MLTINCIVAITQLTLRMKFQNAESAHGQLINLPLLVGKLQDKQVSHSSKLLSRKLMEDAKQN